MLPPLCFLQLMPRSYDNPDDVHNKSSAQPAEAKTESQRAVRRYLAPIGI